MSGKKEKSSGPKEILETAKLRFKLCVEAEAENRKEELEDLRFMVGEQWPTDIKNSRQNDSRPCLTINRIPQFVRQITNDQRQNRPSIKINQVDDKSDLETAKVFQGMVRHIEYNSHADIAYDTAFESAVKSGIGYFRIITDYSDPMSFQQEIMIKRIKDRFSVYLDPFYQEPDGSDAEYGFISEDMPRDEFEAQYPNSEVSGSSNWESLGSIAPEWFTENTVRISEYYYKEYEERELVLLTDKSVHLKSSLPKEMPEGLRVVRERKTLVPIVKWCKINGIEILEETEIPEFVPRGWIPIIPVIGEEQLIDGKNILSGITRQAKDPQRMYNYYASAATEMIALAPKAPFIGVEGQFEGFEDQWKTANTKNHAYLEYRAKSIGGLPAPPPQRTQFEPQVQAITNERAQASEELKATTGIYDATLGNKSNEQSGLAIQRRNAQAQTSNFHFSDNLTRALRHAGRIIINWIPKVYDTAQVVRTIGDDGEITMVQINQIFQEGGEEKSHFLDHGTYDVTVDVGPSFATKRQEAVASMLDLARSLPLAMQNALDILVRNMDFPAAGQVADRIKKTLPPNIVGDDKDQQPLPPQVQAQMQQMNQMIQTLSQQLDESTRAIQTKSVELASNERIAALEAETKLKIELIKHDAKDGQLAFLEEMKEIQHIRAQLPINNGAGGNPAAPPENTPQQQPTGAVSPGQSMGEQP